MKSTETSKYNWKCGDIVWACAFAFDNTHAKLGVHQVPIRGKLTFDRHGAVNSQIAPRYFIPLTKDGKNLALSKAVSLYSRDIADTEGEAWEIYDKRMLECVEWHYSKAQELIDFAKTQKGKADA